MPSKPDKCPAGTVAIDDKCVRVFKDEKDFNFERKSEYERMYLQGIPADSAVPQDWLDDFVKKHGADYDKVVSSTFWIYPKGSIFGRPFSFRKEINDLFQK